MATSNKPKLEFFRIPLNHKEDPNKTFKDFVIEVLGKKKDISNKDAFIALFKHFMTAPERGFAKNDKLKKVLTWIEDKEENIHYDQKPSPNSRKFIISGVLTGGRFSDDSILSDVTDKKNSKKLKRDNSVLKFYYIYLYFPIDYTEGFIMVHSNNSEDTITTILRDYIANLFKGGDYRKPNIEKFCPKSFQDEFRKGAILSSLNFKTTFLNDMPSDNPILQNIKGYDINITITPKNKALDFNAVGTTVMKFFSKGIFKGNLQDKKLTNFDKTRVNVKNPNVNSSKTFEWNAKDNDFTPVVYLKDRIRMMDNNTPDFNNLKSYCDKLFEEQILPELRPDLFVKYVE